MICLNGLNLFCHSSFSDGGVRLRQFVHLTWFFDRSKVKFLTLNGHLQRNGSRHKTHLTYMEVRSYFNLIEICLIRMLRTRFIYEKTELNVKQSQSVRSEANTLAFGNFGMRPMARLGVNDASPKSTTFMLFEVRAESMGGGVLTRYSRGTLHKKRTPLVKQLSPLSTPNLQLLI